MTFDIFTCAFVARTILS